MSKRVIEQGRELVLEIVEPEVERLLARVPLQHADFNLARDETWWWGVRSGKLEIGLDRYAMRIRTDKQDGAGRCVGYAVEIVGEGQSYQRRFPVQSMSDVAQRKVVELIGQKAMQLGETFHYHLRTIPFESARNDDSPPQSKATIPVPCCESASLADFLAGSEPIVGVGDPPEPWQEAAAEIFVTEDVWQEGRQLAHRGGKNESAALFSGRLFRDTQSPELFIVWDACLEAEQAMEGEYSVTFTGETWARAREMLDFRRKRINPNEIICASVHRHPWYPEADAAGCRMCETCAAAKHCGRTTARPSTADFEWHRSVFVGQPWATLLIWGYNAREEEDFRLYGLQNASFKERTIRVLKDQATPT